MWCDQLSQVPGATSSPLVDCAHLPSSSCFGHSEKKYYSLYIYKINAVGVVLYLEVRGMFGT